ncbi:MAG: DUF2341 domain-containing protein [Gammaproteobacteria bacterium]|nr:DUF2341 domain-containing protein [Gammaproteobacteria bacterium]NIV53071.1 DUF2341 domain-containing protein [Gammaproteobacteria bacterium]NIW85698.1 DUF2341 domain-containing protein [Gammaproteobacteria bacterium]NIX87297.1 DUF2341 domain-containing protein [Gammaproteobacteria bacterium]
MQTKRKKDAAPSGRRRFQLEELEPRLLLSADLIPFMDLPGLKTPFAPDAPTPELQRFIDGEPSATNTRNEAIPDAFQEASRFEEGTTELAAALHAAMYEELGEHNGKHTKDEHTKDTEIVTRRELVFIDPGTPDYEQLLQDLQRDRGDGTRIDVVLLDAKQDGVKQITRVLKQHQKLNAIHLVSHGNDGTLKLGNGQLDSKHLSADASHVATWANALSNEADLLIYGCDLASSDKGQALIEELRTLTGTDIAASTDRTGDESKGGDWDLEFTVGSIEAQIPFSPELQQSWTGVLDTDVQLHYGEGSAADLRLRTFDDAAGTWSAEGTSTTAGSTIKWTVNKVAPDSSEELVAVLSDNGTGTQLDMMRWNGSTWTVDWTAGNIASANADKRGFDLAFEQSSGNAIAVYSDDTNNPVYRTWDTTTNTWSAETPVFSSAPGAGTVLWVELESRPNSNEIALAYQDTNDNLHAVNWDGSSWDEANAQTLETSLNRTNSGQPGDYRTFDLAYENSGDLMVAWGVGADVDYSTKAAGSTTWTNPASFSIFTGNITFVDLAAEPGRDRIAFAGVDDNNGTERLGLMTWDGNAWQNVVEADTVFPHIETDGFGEFWAGVGWVGKSGEAVAVYSDADSGVINWANWKTGSGWTVQSDIAAAGVDLLRSVQLESYPDQDKLMAVFSDQSGNLWGATYDGASWAVTNAGTALETNLSDAKSVPFSFSTRMVNNTPVAAADSYSVNEDGSLTVDWWDTAWTMRQTLTFDNLAQTENLTDFPILLKLNSSNIDYSQTQDNGEDLRFFDADGAPLPYQIEQWNEAGDSYVWVQVPQIDGSSNTDFITMYYGNPTAPAGEDPTAVWSSDYRAVYHLNENPGAGGTVTDSAGNFNAVNQGSTDAAGRISNAQDFDGANDYVDIGSDLPIINAASAVTLSAWINPDTLSGSAQIIALSINNGGATTNDSRVSINRVGSDIEATTRATDDNTQLFNVTTTSSPLTAGTWYHVTAVVDFANDDVQIYVDGTAQPLDITPSYTATATPDTNSEEAAIGSEDDGASGYFDGRIDEARIVVGERSADWVKAQHLSMTNALVTFGGEQSAPAEGGVLANDSDADADRLSAVLVSGPANGSLSLNADGAFTYTPNPDFAGSDSFTYMANDGVNDSNVATVTITVNPVNDAPVATGNATSVTEDAALTASGNVLTDDDGAGIDSDLDTGDTLSVSEIDGVTDPSVDVTGSHGSLNWDTDGSYTYTLDNADAAVQALNYGQTLTDTFTYTVSDGNGGTDTATLAITIEGRDDVSFDISSTATVSESGPTAATFTITVGGTVSAGNTANVTVIGGGTAIDGTDYNPAFATALSNAAAGTTGVSFDTGTSTLTFDENFVGPTFSFTLDAQDDAIVEGTETITATLSGASSPNGAASIGTASASTDLADNDTAAVSIAATDPSAGEPASNGQFTVSLSQPSSTDTVVSYTVTGTATSGSDFTALSGSVSIAAGATSATIDVSALDDALLESAETVIVTLDTITSGDAGISIDGAANSDTVIIADNESATVTVSANDAAAAESGSDPGQLTVDLGTVNNTGAPITVSYTVSGTASAGTDYTALSGSVQILDGQQTATIDVTGIVDDALVEGNESVTLTLTGTDNPAVGVDVTPATVAIADNDTPGVTIAESGGSTNVTEGGAADTYTVVLDSQPTADVTVTLTPDGEIDLGAGAGNAITLTFTATNWNVPQTVNVIANDDALVEGAHIGAITTTTASTDANYDGLTVSDVTVNITDNDTAGAGGGNTIAARVGGTGGGGGGGGPTAGPPPGPVPAPSGTEPEELPAEQPTDEITLTSLLPGLSNVSNTELGEAPVAAPQSVFEIPVDTHRDSDHSRQARPHGDARELLLARARQLQAHLAQFTPKAPGAVAEALTLDRALLDALDKLYSQMSSNDNPDTRQRELAYRTVAGAGLTLSAGFLTYLLRAGSLLASALSTMPLWKGFDPLPVLAAGRRRRRQTVVGDSPPGGEAAEDEDEVNLQGILDPDDQRTREDKERERASQARDGP